MSAGFYPLAKGHMAEVWATLVCPVCDGEMREIGDEYEDDEEGKLMLDTYACNHCRILVTYISPADVHEYRQVANRDRRYLIDQF